MTGYRCARCGRVTEPAAWIGVYPVGPSCAKAMGLTGRQGKRLGGVVRLAGEREQGTRVVRDNKTMELFSEDA